MNSTGSIKVLLTTAPSVSVNYPYALYKNGVLYQGWTYSSGTNDETQTVTLTVTYGDLIQFYFNTAGVDYNGCTLHAKTFTIMYTPVISFTTPTITLQ